MQEDKHALGNVDLLWAMLYITYFNQTRGIYKLMSLILFLWFQNKIDTLQRLQRLGVPSHL